MKRAKREKNSVLLGVTSIPRQEVRGIIKVISRKSEVCKALFDAEKMFQIFRMYIYMLHKLSSRLIWLDDWLDVLKVFFLSSKELRTMHAKKRTTKHETIQAASASVA